MRTPQQGHRVIYLCVVLYSMLTVRSDQKIRFEFVPSIKELVMEKLGFRALQDLTQSWPSTL